MKPLPPSRRLADKPVPQQELGNQVCGLGNFYREEPLPNPPESQHCPVRKLQVEQLTAGKKFIQGANFFLTKSLGTSAIFVIS